MPDASRGCNPIVRTNRVRQNNPGAPGAFTEKIKLRSVMRLLIAALLVACATVEGRSGPEEIAVLAAMKLSDQPNYTWLSTVVDDVRTYQLEGRTQRGGFTWMRLPMVLSL